MGSNIIIVLLSLCLFTLAFLLLQTIYYHERKLNRLKIRFLEHLEMLEVNWDPGNIILQTELKKLKNYVNQWFF